MKVSIVTVTYNSSATLRRTMESVLHQTYTDIEYWIIDGNSKDGTIDTVRSYEASFGGRLHWISEPDNGIYDAMNKGVARSTGDIVGILNSDDWFTSNDVVERIVKVFDDNIDAVYGDVHFVRGDNPDKKIYYGSGRLFHPLLLKFGIAPPHPSFYVRKNILDKYGVYDSTFKISGDFDLIARLCHKYHIRTKYIHLDFVTMTDGGASTKDQDAYEVGLSEIKKSCDSLGIKTSRKALSAKKLFAIVGNHL